MRGDGKLVPGIAIWIWIWIWTWADVMDGIIGDQGFLFWKSGARFGHL